MHDGIHAFTQRTLILERKEVLKLEWPKESVLIHAWQRYDFIRNHFVFACLLSRVCSAAFSGLWHAEIWWCKWLKWTEVAPKQGIVHTVGNWGTYPVSWKRVVSSVHRCILKHPPWKLNVTEVLYTKGRHGTCGVPTSYTTLSCKLPPSRMRSGDKSVAKYSVSESVNPLSGN